MRQIMPVCDEMVVQKLTACMRKAINFARDSGRIHGGRKIAQPVCVNSSELKRRTKKSSVDIFKFCRTLPTDVATTALGRQLVRSGMAVGANYRGACRAKSKADFVSKMTNAEEESDETQFWLEVLIDAGVVQKATVEKLLDQADQLTRIFVASINTARGGSR